MPSTIKSSFKDIKVYRIWDGDIFVIESGAPHWAVLSKEQYHSLFKIVYKEEYKIVYKEEWSYKAIC